LSHIDSLTINELKNTYRYFKVMTGYDKAEYGGNLITIFGAGPNVFEYEAPGLSSERAAFVTHGATFLFPNTVGCGSMANDAGTELAVKVKLDSSIHQGVSSLNPALITMDNLQCADADAKGYLIGTFSYAWNKVNYCNTAECSGPVSSDPSYITYAYFLLSYADLGVGYTHRKLQLVPPKE
jgi:hypothetical protein